jgi:hypothetical protein
MTFLVFILGLALGVGFHFWSFIRLRKRIEKVLSFVSDDPSQLNSLPLVYLVRREISNLDRQKLGNLARVNGTSSHRLFAGR